VALESETDCLREFTILNQQFLFAEASPKGGSSEPQGFRYQPEFLGEAEEKTLAEELSRLPLWPLDFHGDLGNRRVASFGLRYDYARRAVENAEEPPEFLHALRRKIAAFAGRDAEEFCQIGVNEYRPGAGIGWHKDKPEFGDIVGVSLLSPAKMRFRKADGERWVRASRILEPRSVYLLTGEARQVWKHSVPPVTSLRYAVMFRTLSPGRHTTILDDSQER
jgi:alkylated DNA repair dioxygenase AlkB